MENRKNDNFAPTIAIPPGISIKENMVYLGMNQLELAARLDITPKHLSHILNGTAPITYETALKLETVIGPSAQFWMNLEANYQLNKTRLEKIETMESDLEILHEIPYTAMSENGWVKETSSRTERVLNCREFFGVSSLTAIQPSYSAVFRKQKHKHNISDLAVLAWLRQAEREAFASKVNNKFNKSNLKRLIPAFRALTMKEPKHFFPELKKLCAECGIALVLVQCLPKTYICGATIWRNENAIVALSVRGKRADIFWFTFFHEIAHLLAHSKKEFHICYERDSEEDEADRLASNYLIPDELYKQFIDNYPYTEKQWIHSYAKEIGIAPSILVGRLLHDDLINYKDYSDMRPSFEITREQ